jgi:hypothetical protein
MIFVRLAGGSRRFGFFSNRTRPDWSSIRYKAEALIDGLAGGLEDPASVAWAGQGKLVPPIKMARNSNPPNSCLTMLWTT